MLSGRLPGTPGLSDCPRLPAGPRPGRGRGRGRPLPLAIAEPLIMSPGPDRGLWTGRGGPGVRGAADHEIMISIMSLSLVLI